MAGWNKERERQAGREREREREMKQDFFKAEIPRNGHKKNHRLRNEIQRYQQWIKIIL